MATTTAMLKPQIEYQEMREREHVPLLSGSIRFGGGAQGRGLERQLKSDVLLPNGADL